MTPPVRVVQWIDASVTHDESKRDDLERPVPVTSVGFVIEETEEHIILAQEIIVGREGVQYRCSTAIPWVSVVKQKRHKPPRSAGP